MPKSKFSSEEQFQLILECRQSGLSDARWCMEHGIRPTTFYNWVSRLRKKGVTLPEPVHAQEYLPNKPQEVVKLEVVSEHFYEEPVSKRETSPFISDVFSSVMKLEIGNSILSISNATEPALLAQVIHLLQEKVC